jgi:hypothetical protein
VIVFSETDLQRLMMRYCSYHERSRTHLSLDKDTPISRPVTPGDGKIVAIPEVGGRPPSSLRTPCGLNAPREGVTGRHALRSDWSSDYENQPSAFIAAKDNNRLAQLPNRPSHAHLRADTLREDIIHPPARSGSPFRPPAESTDRSRIDFLVGTARSLLNARLS